MLSLYFLMLLGTSNLSISPPTLFSFAAGLVAFFFIVVCVLIFIFVYDNMRKQRKTVAAT
jgi:hypothetical protein